jgi:hypothetical protein
MTTVTGPFIGTLTDSSGNKLTATTNGITLTLAKPVEPPDPPTGPTGRQFSVYLKMWPNARQVTLAQAAKPGITEVRLSFLQGSPLGLPGWGSQDRAGVAADAAALRDRGVAVTASIGGESGAVRTNDRVACLAGIGALHSQIGLDRIDWDVEASALVADDVLAISQTVHDRWGITTTMAPNGSNVAAYLPVAVELHRRRLLVAYGQQFYGSRSGVTYGAAAGRIAEAVRAGIPERLIQVGMWVGDNDARRWPIGTCVTYAKDFRAQWPYIGGAYLWSESHGEVADWVARVSAAMR